MTSLAGDPLFQLNLMIWLTWAKAGPKISGIRPVFYEAGYTIQAIAPSIGLSAAQLVKLGRAEIPVNQSASPELVIISEKLKQFIVIECKRNSFGPNSRNARQANVLLTISGPEWASNIGMKSPGLWDSFVLYSLPALVHDLMFQTLTELGDNLSAAKFTSVHSGALGIDIRDDGVFLQVVSKIDAPIETLYEGSLNNWIQVANFDHEEDPRPIYLIPIDPSISSQDDFGRMVLERRLRASIVSNLGSKLDEEEFEVLEEKIIKDAIEVWDLWRDVNAKKSIRRISRNHISSIIKELRKIHDDISYQQGVLRFRAITQRTADQIRRHFRSADFRQGEIDWNPQRGFEDIHDEWL